MKKLIIVSVLFFGLNNLFSQNKDLDFSIVKFEEIGSSGIKFFYKFSGENFKELFYKKRDNFFIKVSYRKTIDDDFLEILNKKIENYVGHIKIPGGIYPGYEIKISSLYNNSTLVDTILKIKKIKFIEIKKSKKIKISKSIDITNDSIDFFINGEFTGAYVDNGFFYNKIIEEGSGIWFDLNGLIGITELGEVFMFSGIDPFNPNYISYYNSGLYLKYNSRVVLVRENYIFPVSWFIQNGPILVFNGKNYCGKYKETKEKISAIGFDGNKLYYIVSIDDMSLYNFSKKLIKKGIDMALFINNDTYYYDSFRKSNIPDFRKIIFYKK